jgi:hypothetical protein
LRQPGAHHFAAERIRASTRRSSSSRPATAGRGVSLTLFVSTLDRHSRSATR